MSFCLSTWNICTEKEEPHYFSRFSLKCYSNIYFRRTAGVCLCVLSICQLLFSFLPLYLFKYFHLSPNVWHCVTVTVTGKFKIGLKLAYEKKITKRDTIDREQHSKENRESDRKKVSLKWPTLSFPKRMNLKEKNRTICKKKKGCHSLLGYVWNCKLHSSDGWIFYFEPFTWIDCVDIWFFLHIFCILCYLWTEYNRWHDLFFPSSISFFPLQDNKKKRRKRLKFKN